MALRSRFSFELLLLSVFCLPIAFCELSAANEIRVFPLDQADLSGNGLSSISPGQMNMGQIRFGSIPAGPETDGKGMSIDLLPGQGVLVVSMEPVAVQSLARLTGAFRTTSQELAVALVALSSPVDGQIGYTHSTGPELRMDGYRTFDLIYAPPAKKLQWAVQAVNSPYASLAGTVYIDNIAVHDLDPEVTGAPASLQVAGNFEGGLKDLKTNINNVNGTVTPVFQSLTDIAVRLSLNPFNLAANFGTVVQNVDTQFPFTLLAEITAERELASEGTFALVLTNGYQNVAVFRRVNELPLISAGNPERVMIGGDFNVNNPQVPILAVVQDGGPDVNSSIVVDDLNLLLRPKFGPDPTPTPTPTPPSIIVPINGLPQDAKPLELVEIPAGSGIDSFYMGKYEITMSQWASVMGTHPEMTGNYPIHSVTWSQCKIFIEKLNALSIGTFRLPKENEWEYACRADTYTEYYWGNSGLFSEDYGWFNSTLHEVGLKKPNGFGLFDMSGNVWEWCEDLYKTFRIVRGGSWKYPVGVAGSGYRHWLDPNYSYDDVGFRIVREK